MTHAFIPSTQEADAGRSEFKASMVYRMRPRTARAIQKNHVWKNKQPYKQKPKIKRLSITILESAYVIDASPSSCVGQHLRPKCVLPKFIGQEP